MNIDVTLDARQLNCPMPILQTKKALANMEAGQRLKVLATDPDSPADMQVFCRQTGHILLKNDRNDQSEYEFIIEKNQASQALG